MGPREPAHAVVPLLAQSFVESRASTTSGSASPNREGAGTAEPSPQRLSAPQQDKPRDEGVYYWTDETLRDKVKFVEEVGFGNWGSLWLGLVKPERQESVALKLVHRSKDTTSAARVKALWNEYKSLRPLRLTAHPNLINFHAFVLTPSYSIVIMDFHPRLIQVAIPESRAIVYASQLFSAVEHLHVHGITHNDIKPSNILLAADDRPVLIDFGFAQQWDTKSPDRFLSSLSWGTIEYLSPERARGHLHDERLSDIWALGITLYELVVGRTPFEKTEDEDFLTRAQLEIYYHRTLTGQMFGDYSISPELESLVSLMVAVDPRSRIQSCGKALRHQFFNHVDIGAVPFSTPLNHAQSPLSAEIKVSCAKKSARSTPKKKKGDKSFEFFHDDSPAKSPQVEALVTPFPPGPAPFGNRTNRSNSLVVSPPRLNKAKLVVGRNVPASRIPVRACAVTLPVVKPAAAQEISSIVENEQNCATDIGKSSNIRAQPPAPPRTIHTPSGSIVFVKRKPVPLAKDERSLCDSATSSQQLLFRAVQQATTASCNSGLEPDKAGLTSLDFIKRPEDTSHVKRSSSQKFFTPSKSTLSDKAGKSSHPALPNVTRADKWRGRFMMLLQASANASCLPRSAIDAEAQKLRLEEFSAHVQHILEDRRSNGGNVGRLTVADSQSRFSAGLKEQVQQTCEASHAQTQEEDSVSEASSHSKPHRGASKRSPEPVVKAIKASSTPPSSSPGQGFKPGHRRIPTAIRNVPCVMLHESGDEADESAEPESPNFGNTPGPKIASPPPAPRVVTPSRQLPTWVSTESDEDGSASSIEDEPTVTFGMTPQAERPRAVSTLGQQAVPRKHMSTNPREATQLSVSIEAECAGVSPNSLISTARAFESRATSPVLGDLPFDNLSTRIEITSASTLRSSTQGHSRSRSVMSFLTPRSISQSSATPTSERTASRETVAMDKKHDSKKQGGKIRRTLSRIFR
ncbi:serine/threonine-protein kinase [Sporobolomyces koalae]|uniref:serine/threonine-protein kinase n=1 Tax=Sporobolomyces koalae TaxID=500713 RepID=UPI00317F617D